MRSQRSIVTVAARPWRRLTPDWRRNTRSSCERQRTIRSLRINLQTFHVISRILSLLTMLVYFRTFTYHSYMVIGIYSPTEFTYSLTEILIPDFVLLF